MTKVRISGSMLNEVTSEHIPRFVEMVEAKFPYIRYSYLYKCFLWYETKTVGEEYKRIQSQRWYSARSKNELQQYVKDWFPKAEVHPYVSEHERKCSESWKVMNELEIKEGTIYTKETYTKLTQKLSEIWEIKQLKRCLDQFSDYEWKYHGKSKKEYQFIRKQKS